MITACLFDLDGVIVDTARYHFLAWKRVADELGVKFNETDNERLKGVSRMRSLEILIELGDLELSSEQKIFYADKKNTLFVESLRHMTPNEIFPGVRALLSELKRSDRKIGLASGSKNAALVVEILDIHSCFDVIVDGTMIVNSKPDPEIFLLTAKRLGTQPDLCVVFEDAAAGVEAALAAGMRCVGIGNYQTLSKADRVIARTGDFSVQALDQL